jgi:hypothetical protein
LAFISRTRVGTRKWYLGLDQGLYYTNNRNTFPFCSDCFPWFLILILILKATGPEPLPSLVLH